MHTECTEKESSRLAQDVLLLRHSLGEINMKCLVLLTMFCKCRRLKLSSPSAKTFTKQMHFANIHTHN